MAFPHPFVKVENNQVVESAVYDQLTGERILCWPIDGKEMVAQEDKRYAYTPPPPRESEPPVPAPGIGPEQAAEMVEDAANNIPAPKLAGGERPGDPAPETPKRGPGRPRKEA